MSCFHNILVGVDLSQTDRGATFDASTEIAIRHARWLAREGGARLTFLSAFEDKPAQRRRVLDELVRSAQEAAIEAEAVVVPGRPSVEIIRQVIRGDHDLVVVGTHDPKGLQRLLIGSTACQLVHDCPCPVWVSKLEQPTPPRNILVASDLSQLSAAAVRIGLGIGHLAKAPAHILDVVAFPLDRLWSPSPAAPEIESYHSRVRAKTEIALRDQVQQSGGTNSDPTVTVHVADSDGLPDHAIRQFIDDHQIDLLVLGSAARHGLSGLLVGNTSERLLPKVPCSVVVVKPADFQCRLDLTTT